MRSNTAEFSVLLADIRQSQHCRKDERTNKLTAEQAEFSAYAEKHGYAYIVLDEHPRAVRRRAYADNFRFDRVR